MTTTTFSDAELELIDRALMMLSTETAEEYRLANSALSRIAAIQAERVAERKAQAEAEAAAKAREAERQARIKAHDLAPPMVEIQISCDSDFSRKGFSRKVKALGGDFTECRGGTVERYVTLPATPAGLALADELHRTFTPGKKVVTWIARGAAHWTGYRDDHVLYIPQSSAHPSEQFLRIYRAWRARIRT